MALYRIGTDLEFAFKMYEEVTYSVDNEDYNIINRLVIKTGQKLYVLQACYYKNPNKQITLDANEEDKLTETDCSTAISKIFDQLPYDGNFNTLNNILSNDVYPLVCDYKDPVTHSIKTYKKLNKFVLEFDNIILSKDDP